MYFFRDFNKISNDFCGRLDRLMLLISIPLMKNPWKVSNCFGTLSERAGADWNYFPAQWSCVVCLPWQRPMATARPTPTQRTSDRCLKSLLEFSHDSAVEKHSLSLHIFYLNLTPVDLEGCSLSPAAILRPFYKLSDENKNVFVLKLLK